MIRLVSKMDKCVCRGKMITPAMGNHTRATIGFVALMYLERLEVLKGLGSDRIGLSCIT